MQLIYSIKKFGQMSRSMSALRENIGLLQHFSNLLSVITISICFILKIPQIITILKVKSAKGINIIGLLMELSR